MAQVPESLWKTARGDQTENPAGRAAKRPKTPGSGRKKGTPNRRTLLKRQAIEAAATMSPVEFMLNVMRAPEAEPRLRLDAAKSVAQFLHTKPTSASKRGDQTKVVEPLTWTAERAEWLAYLRANRKPCFEEQIKAYERLERISNGTADAADIEAHAGDLHWFGVGDVGGPYTEETDPLHQSRPTPRLTRDE